MTSCQCSQSRFHTSMAMGEPSVSPARTPASHSIWSDSIFIRAPRPYPPMRRFSSTLIRSAETGNPAGIPSRIPTRPRPCDSPAVVNRKVIPSSSSYITAEPDLGRAPLLHILDAVRSGAPGSRRRRERVDERRQLQDQEPGRRNPKQQLVPAYVARDPQRPDDRIADGDRPEEIAEV